MEKFFLSYATAYLPAIALASVGRLTLIEFIETEVSQNRRPETLRRSSRGLSPEGVERPIA